MQNSNQKELANSGIDVGALLKSYLASKKIVKSVLARRIGKSNAEILRYQKRASLSTDILLSLSHVLKHNFFLDIAAVLPQEYTTNATKDTATTDRIADLELQVKLLETEKAVLLEAMRK